MSKRPSEMMIDNNNAGICRPATASGQGDVGMLRHGEWGRGLRFRSKFSMTLSLTLLISTFMFGGWFAPASVCAVDQVIFITSGTSWTVPADWNSSANSIEVIGGGGGGAGPTANTGSGGGGGGAYAKVTNLTLTPSGNVTIQVGTGGTGEISGTATWFNGATCLGSSVCGTFGTASLNATGGAGGLAADSVGIIKYDGGTGGTGSTTGDTGAGGGGAAGPSGIGKNGGNGAASTASGGGGGCNGGSSTAGSAGVTNIGGTGGTGPTGIVGPTGTTGAGTNATAGSGAGGSGAGGTTVTPGGNGAMQVVWTATDLSTAGPGGGGGGAGNGGTAGAGGGYGAGGGGGETVAGNGTPGIIVITYTPEVNVAPVITSNGSGATASTSVAENTTAVTTVTATDANVGQTLTYSISGGADAAKFSIVGATGVLTFVSAPNFESATDVGGNNVYDVTVTVTDNGTGNLTDTQAIAVTVTDVNENPVITSNGGAATASVSIDENTTAVTTVTATDPDTGQTKNYSISGGLDAAKFSIVGATGVLTFVAAPDFEAPTDSGGNNVYDVIVTVTDNGTGNLTDTQSIAVTVLDVVSEGPVCTPAAMTISVTPATQNVRAGFAITYTVMVTNNDSVECADLTVNLGLVDNPVTPTTNFALSTLSAASRVIAPQTSGNVTLTVTAQPAGVETSTLTSTVTATATGHVAQNDAAVSTIMNYNPMIHSSKSTNSTKWAANGGWGITGGKYGEFTCATCHEKGTGNIKRVKALIDTPNTDPWVGSNTQTVAGTLSSTTGANSYGDDARVPLTSSNMVCEVCHSATTVHRYNSSTGVTDFNHMSANQTDCISCHAHNQGFDASCTTCHGYPPVDAGTLVIVTSRPTGSATAGAHNTHVATFSISCAICHYNSTGSGATHNVNGQVSLGFVNLPTGTGGVSSGSYNGQATVTYNSTYAGTTVSSGGTKTCTNYCHGSTIGAAGAVWDNPLTGECGDCHGAAVATPPTRVNHPRHVGTAAGQLGLTCDKCHGPGYAGGLAPGGHLSGSVTYDVSGLTGNTPTYRGFSTVQQTGALAPSGTYGNCGNVYCHSNVQSVNGTAAASVYATPTWGAASVACDSCHGQAAHTNGQPSTGSHEIHVTTRGIVCSACHNGAGDETAVHANGLINISLSGGGTYTQGNHAPGAGGYGTCSNVACHINKITPTWGVASTCTSCHTAGGAGLGDPTTGLHATTNLVDHDDVFGTGGTCTSCHSATTSLASSLHFNGTVENSGVATYTWNLTNIPAGYVRASDSCAAAGSCHTDGGTWNRRWTGVVDTAWAYANLAESATVCGNCHGSFVTGWNIVGATDHVNPDVTNDANGATADNPDTLATSKLNHGECTKCHAWGNATYSTGLKHVNNTLEMNSALDTSPGDGDCTTVCHSGQALTMNAASGWTDATVVGDGVACGDCHNGGVTRLGQSAAHAAHGATSTLLIANPASVALCVACHGNDGTGVTHNNNSVSWATNLTYSQAATRGNLTGTCTGTAGCHVATTNIAWNATPTNCNQCHYSTTDTANWGWTGTAGNISMINSTEYTGKGHGQATINTVAAAKDCMVCHDITMAHDQTATLTGSNPFRLKTAFTCNTNAAGCHTISGLLGTHDQATAGAKYIWSFASKCSDCHDPHGDGTNLTMIHSDLADKGSAANWVRNTPDAAIETMVFTNTTGILADSYAEPSTTFDGICQECHTATTSMKDNLVANGANHTATTGCVSCHAHGEGFKAAGCNGCHGGDNATLANKNFWPGASGTLTPDRPGEHDKHVTALAAKLYSETLAQIVTDTTFTSEVKQKAICDYCHNDAAGAGGSGHDGTAAPADVGSFNRIFDAAVDSGTAGSYTPGNGSNGVCSNVDCHNNNPTATTPTNYDWYDGATSACVMCHVAGGTGTVDPLSGLHKAGTLTSSTPHDDAFATSATCTTCHSTMSAFMSGTHGDAINNGNTVSSLGLVVGLYTQTSTVGNGSGTCSGGTAGAAGCHDSIFDAGSWARKWDDTISYQTGGNQCAGCHGGFNNDWTFGSAANTTDLAVSHTYDWNNDTVSNELVGKHLNNTANTTKCNICHVYADSPYSLTWGTGTHGNDKIAMNTMGGANTYSATTWTCNNTCHTEGGSHAMEASSSSGTRVENIAGPALTCASCHSTYTTHIDADGAAGVYTSGNCTDCHLAHADGTTGVNDIEISTVYTGTTAVPTMTTADGTTALYSSHGYKIRLGGNATIVYAKSTEAEWCWACHDDQATKITEWQANNNTSTGAIAYNYGQLYTTITGTTETSNWIGAFWRSAKGLTTSDPYYYKRGAIRSTHSANYSGTTPTSDAATTWKGSLINTVAGYSTTYNKGENLDAVANIRCSYCHDVHGTHDGIKGDLNPTGGTPSGQPYLRGTWLGNPYQEDGAPRFGMASFTNQGPTKYGIVPRASASPTNNGSATAGLNVGGWWIDQNSGNPVENHVTTSFRTASGFAGLCEQCHGSDKNGTWLNTEINAIDQITGELLWVSGGNGHANSVMGASGATAAANNIFSRAKRGALTRVDGQTAKVNVDMGLATETTSGYSYRNGTSYNWNPSVLMTDTTTKSTGKPYAFQFFAWNTTLQATAQDSSFATGSVELTLNTGTGDDTSDAAQANYHTFSCSKCHNPHASRLPKLMITNCLDTNHNSWDDNSAFTGTALPAGNYAGLRHSQWAGAQNCHRLDARATANGGATTVGVGWNKVTPWIEDTSPNTTITAEPTTLLTY